MNLTLPAISSHISLRPGDNVPDSHYIAKAQDSGFWADFYRTFSDLGCLFAPIDCFELKINPYFGHYGYRWHPVACRPRYFHIGIDVHAQQGQAIAAVSDGFLEYSGYADVNGNYIVLSHPDIRTADGFVLQSLYMNCKELNVRFSLLQKILREYVSTGMSMANVPVSKGQIIATVGSSGHRLGYNPHLHLQFEMVRGQQRVSLSPLLLYGLDETENLTSQMASVQEYQVFRASRSGDNDLTMYDKFINIP